VGFFTLNALSAADMAVIPSLCEYLSANGANQILKIIEMIRARSNPDLQYRVLITMYDERDTSARVVYSKLMANFRDHSFETIVPYDTKMKESQIMKLPVIVYDQSSRSGHEYMQLAKELLNGSRATARPPVVEELRPSLAAAM
jgi:chromosome partitioning protein